MTKTKELWSGFADMLQGNKELCCRLHQQAVAEGEAIQSVMVSTYRLRHRRFGDRPSSPPEGGG